MPPIRHQALDLGEHAAGKLGIARSKGDDNRFRIFAEQTKDEFLERGPHLMKFDRDHDARSVQRCIGLRIVLHCNLPRILLRAASERLFASTA